MVRAGGRKPDSVTSRPSGIEKYGANEMDDVLGLNAAVDLGGARRRSWGGEREVLSLSRLSDVVEEKVKKKKKKKKGKAGAAEEDDEDEEEDEDKVNFTKKGDDDDNEDGYRPTQGWSRSDYYGGEDLGDETDLSNDEELIYEEAKKLEELRAKRLKDGGGEDILASLIGAAEAHEPEKPAVQESAVKAAAKEAQFDSLFGVEAEADKVERDLSKLSMEQQRDLIKKEAPELMPLLQDYQVKLKKLKWMMPLLTSDALTEMALSGASYVKAKASLLLNTLANLSFYLLLRAEGAPVRAHPVVAQLVWLRELHEKFATIDKKLEPQLKKAVKHAQKVTKVNRQMKDVGVNPASSKDDKKPTKEALSSAPPAKATLRERVEQIRRSRPAQPAKDEDKRISGAMPSTGDLLKLPAMKKKTSKAKAVLEEQEEMADPTLGQWRPSATLQAEIGDVHKRMQEQAAKAKPVSADDNVAPRARNSASKADSALEELKGPHARREELDDECEEDEEEEEDPAKIEADRKRAAKEAKAAERLKAKAAAQLRPEPEVDDRRWATKQILENRGLVRQRKKFSGNARVANRKKYEQAMKKRRALVQEVREGAADGVTYHGEETGLRTHVKKSLKLG